MEAQRNRIIRISLGLSLLRGNNFEYTFQKFLNPICGFIIEVTARVFYPLDIICKRNMQMS